MVIRLLFVVCSVMLCFFKNSLATDTITPALPLSDGQTLISKEGNFKLGFFTRQASQNRYLAIWHNKISNGTSVWVANRATPLTDTNGVLKLTNSGNLILLNRSQAIVWSSNSSSDAKTSQKHQLVQAQLLDSGNLIVKFQNNENPNDYLWQSFDHPHNILLPGMKLGWNLKTGQNRFLVSWKTPSDPSPGDYTYGIDLRGVPQIIQWKQNIVLYRIGSWNGVRFTGTPYMNPNPVYDYNLVTTQDEIYFTYTLKNDSVVSELILNETIGFAARVVWNDRNRKWVFNKATPLDQCESYNTCGANGLCDFEASPACVCLDGFVPKSKGNWDSKIWSDGCVLRRAFDCESGEGFRRFKGLKLPDTSSAAVMVSEAKSVEDCEAMCLKKCNCTAYAVADIKQGRGCLLWFANLIDIRTFPENGQELYVKMASSELVRGSNQSNNSNQGKSDGKGKRRLVVIVTCVPLFSGVLLLVLVMYIWKKRMRNREGKHNFEEDSKELEFSMLDFATVSVATNNFAFVNKLGQGGFGSVYKGEINGQEVAIKRLSRSSKQGVNEFKNEVILISKLQHRNLVKLVGCCIQGEEKILIYEYMPNKSLDLIIFDQTRSVILDWQKRFDIICGIARGLLYLHQDSRLRIVHRDLKTSNILLDHDVNPKISDFGLARSFGGDQSEANTGRVVGTYGYMPPEYTTDGLSSVKSDVFSFGVIVLEIVSGMKNRGFLHPDHNHNLLGHAWRLWTEGNPSELLDPVIKNSSINSADEVLRCIHVGLLCVQQSRDERPSMSSVILMLGSENTTLRLPNRPGFFREKNSEQTSSTSRVDETCSANEVTITMLEAR